MQPTVVLVCRGCCCGTSQKHPRTDHVAQEEALLKAAAATPEVEVRLVDCLDECDRSNVVVVRRPDRPRKERDTWLGGVLSDRATDELVGWVEQGGPDRLPDAVAGLRFRHVPPRKR